VPHSVPRLGDARCRTPYRRRVLSHPAGTIAAWTGMSSWVSHAQVASVYGHRFEPLLEVLRRRPGGRCDSPIGGARRVLAARAAAPGRQRLVQPLPRDPCAPAHASRPKAPVATPVLRYSRRSVISPLPRGCRHRLHGSRRRCRSSA
jgi:hypothetical protein